jgi:hypothetical protein
MSESSSSNSGGGIGVLGLLGCIFVTLKLCNVIDWSWWWVTCPFWGGLALLFGDLYGAAAVCGLAAAIAAIVAAVANRRKR